MSVNRITATEAAHQAIRRLCADRGAPVMFVQSGGCCAGSTPMCYPAGEFIVGAGDVLLGNIEGCPFYIDYALDQAWGESTFRLDVAPGEPEGFSLAAGPGTHFVTRSTSCSSERSSDEHAHRLPGGDRVARETGGDHT